MTDDKPKMARVAPEHIEQLEADLSSPFPFGRGSTRHADAAQYKAWVEKHDAQVIKEAE